MRNHQDVEDTNVPNTNALPDKVKINLNMLGALMLNGVGGELDGWRCRNRPVDHDSGLCSSRSQHASATSLATTWYSALALELETTFRCFED
jgi:hypothetical protein